MTVKLLTEQHLRFLSLKEGCTGSCVSIQVKMPHCWQSHVGAQLLCFDQVITHNLLNMSRLILFIRNISYLNVIVEGCYFSINDLIKSVLGYSNTIWLIDEHWWLVVTSYVDENSCVISSLVDTTLICSPQ